MGKLIDLTGQKFGKLTVLEHLGRINGSKEHYWKCQCECGQETSVKGNSLRSGNTKSCGCAKYDGLRQYNENQSESSKIPVGTKFGKLTVIEDIGYREQVEGHSRRWYKCQCECGNIKEVMGNMLKQGQTSSCGHCEFLSKGEYLIKQILEENKVNYEYDTIFPELFQESGRKLRFDFIIYDENFDKPIRFIEYDGRQHFTGPDTNFWGHSKDTLETIQEKDKIKNEFCLKHNYCLVRIPYTKTKITYDDIFGDEYVLKEE